ncbi:MAG: signal peptidase I [Clostridia bacterium]|nr:signal peptidase I [Clostridia bacterium]
MFAEVRKSLYNAQSKSKINIVLNVLIVIMVIALIIEISFGINYAGYYVVHSSMSPTLTGAVDYNVDGGDYVYVNKNAQPTYGDIVVVSKDKDTTIIKRVIALGGDYVKLVNGELQIKYKGSENFVTVNEPYVAAENNTSNTKNTYPKNNLDEGYFVEEGRMFLLGDNRDVSVDSRDSGSFPLTSLYGVVTNWSLKNKKFLTSLHNYFKFQLPRYFGFN